MCNGKTQDRNQVYLFSWCLYLLSATVLNPEDWFVHSMKVWDDLSWGGGALFVVGVPPYWVCAPWYRTQTSPHPFNPPTLFQLFAEVTFWSFCALSFRRTAEVRVQRRKLDLCSSYELEWTRPPCLYILGSSEQCGWQALSVERNRKKKKNTQVRWSKNSTGLFGLVLVLMNTCALLFFSPLPHR